MFIVLKKIVAKPLQTAAIPPQNRGAVLHEVRPYNGD